MTTTSRKETKRDRRPQVAGARQRLRRRPSVMVSVLLTIDQYEALERIVDETGQSRSALLRHGCNLVVTEFE